MLTTNQPSVFRRHFSGLSRFELPEPGQLGNPAFSFNLNRPPIPGVNSRPISLNEMVWMNEAFVALKQRVAVKLGELESSCRVALREREDRENVQLAYSFGFRYNGIRL